jgi:hypothetical protein
MIEDSFGSRYGSVHIIIPFSCLFACLLESPRASCKMSRIKEKEINNKIQNMVMYIFIINNDYE